MTIRVIPRLDIKGPNLVKGIHLEGLRVLGKPERFARAYYEQGADELLYMDAVASLYGRNSLDDIVTRTSREIFIPLCVGGGLRTVDDMRRVLRAGADKVAVNTAALMTPELIRQAAKAFGSSTVVLSIEAIQTRPGHFECFTDGGREATGREVVDWAVQAVELGAGEILLTSVDREGTGRGFDLALTRAVADAVSVPVVASGGAGAVQDIVDVVLDGGADAVAVAAMLHYDAIERLDFTADDFAAEGNVEFRRRQGSFGRVQPMALDDLKLGLSATLEVRR